MAAIQASGQLPDVTRSEIVFASIGYIQLELLKWREGVSIFKLEMMKASAVSYKSVVFEDVLVAVMSLNVGFCYESVSFARWGTRMMVGSSLGLCTPAGRAEEKTEPQCPSSAHCHLRDSSRKCRGEHLANWNGTYLARFWEYAGLRSSYFELAIFNL